MSRIKFLLFLVDGPPQLLGYQWIGDRVPVVDLQRVKRNIELEQDEVSWGPNAIFQFPKQDGTGAISKALAAHIPPERIQLSTSVDSIDPYTKRINLADKRQDHYDALISTMPIPELTKRCSLQEKIKEADQLRHTHVYVVGVALDIPIPDHLADKTWIYCPEEKTLFYRVTPFSTFSPDHVPDIKKQCSFLCEISKPGNELLVDPTSFITPTLAELKAIGLVDCANVHTHTHLMTTEYGYPVPTQNRDDLLNKIMPALEDLKIFSRGRFGGWKYEVANMDHSLMQGVEVVDRILNGTEETTWPQPHVVNAGEK